MRRELPHLLVPVAQHVLLVGTDQAIHRPQHQLHVPHERKSDKFVAAATYMVTCQGGICM